jgi:hypothetical protein
MHAPHVILLFGGLVSVNSHIVWTHCFCAAESKLKQLVPVVYVFAQRIRSLQPHTLRCQRITVCCQTRAVGETHPRFVSWLHFPESLQSVAAHPPNNRMESNSSPAFGFGCCLSRFDCRSAIHVYFPGCCGSCGALATTRSTTASSSSLSSP